MMKYLLGFSLLILTALAFSQNPPQTVAVRRIAMGENAELAALKSNYTVTLASAEKDKPSQVLSFVIASSKFEAASGDTSVTFKGSVLEQEGGTLLFTYTLNIIVPVNRDEFAAGSNQPVSRNIVYSNSGIQSSAIVTLDQPLKIFTSGNREYTLSVIKAEKAK